MGGGGLRGAADAAHWMSMFGCHCILQHVPRMFAFMFSVFRRCFNSHSFLCVCWISSGILKTLFFHLYLFGPANSNSSVVIRIRKNKTTFRGAGILIDFHFSELRVV